MRVLVHGGDGYCGWPTVLHLGARGYTVRPHLLSKRLLRSILSIALRYRDRVDPVTLRPQVDWRRAVNPRPAPARREPDAARV